MHRGETVEIDDMTWKKIEYAFRTEFWASDSTYIGGMSCSFHSYMRCDSDAVTWVHWSMTDTAEIWFDPSIEVGDTVPGTWFLGQLPDTAVMYAIDTLPDLSGADRRMYHFTGVAGQYGFIEGLGAPMVNWDLGQYYPFDNAWLVGQSESDTPLSGCVVTVGLDEAHGGRMGPRIVENPVTDDLRLVDLPPTGGRYAILDPTGRLVLSGPVANGSVDVRHLAFGTYVVLFEDQDGRALGSARFMRAAIR